MTPMDEEPVAEQQATRTSKRRLITALLLYAGLAAVAAVRLEGRPRLVVWLFLGLFAVKTLLVVLRQKND